MGTVQSSGKLVTLKNGRTRLLRSKLVRRQIVEETLKPRASVALIARAHDVKTMAWIMSLDWPGTCSCMPKSLNR